MKTPHPYIAKTCKFAVVALLLLSLTPYAPASIYITDLPSHFVVQYAIGCFVLGAVAFYLRLRWFYGLILVLAFALNMAILLPYIDRGQDAARPPKTLKVLQVNVLTQNRNASLLAKLLKQEMPDIVVLAEINSAFLTYISDIKPQYPVQITQHKVAILSRYPAKDISPPRDTYAAAQISALTITWQGQDIDVVTLHTPTPLQNLPRRDAELADAADFIRSRQNPVIFAGDVNATPWCPAMQAFTAETGLVSARRHNGILPSWPQWLPAAFLRLPIDHIYADQSLKAHAAYLAPPLGSDHLPSIALFSHVAAQNTDK